ncbi:MAG TPA: hypothetical protein PLU95_02850 [Syntrophales bacterium]|nr:hypothetical protein [Syntrophales bacterium]
MKKLNDRRNKMNKIIAMGFVGLLMGCQGAVVTATKWGETAGGPGKVVKCERADLRDKREIDETFARHNGHKLVYISEYTTGNKLGTDAIVCFEYEK